LSSTSEPLSTLYIPRGWIHFQSLSIIYKYRRTQPRTQAIFSHILVPPGVPRIVVDIYCT
jgi:hypothetical protein